ncbi:hypothetical protein [Streptomyces sp. NPDC086023]|uniref:hypothetical protein n=1 Tax=Streptomyces sp. NPDC086023 TaxID=3365746 RepID=UPI0037CD2FC4
MSRSYRRLGTLGACVAAAVALGFPAPASAAVDDLTIYAKEVPSGGESPGNEEPEVGQSFAFADDLYRKKGGPTIGRDGVSCTVVRAGSGGNPSDMQCIGTLTLNGGPGGQLAVQALVSVNPDDEALPSFDGAITGGTGDFKDARGYIRFSDGGNGYQKLELHFFR